MRKEKVWESHLVTRFSCLFATLERRKPFGSPAARWSPGQQLALSCVMLAHLLVWENITANTEVLEVLGCPITEVISSTGTLASTIALRQKETEYIFISWNTEAESINVKHLIPESERKEGGGGGGAGKHHGFKTIKALLKKCIVFADIVASFDSYKILNWGLKGTEDGVLTWLCSLSFSESLTISVWQSYCCQTDIWHWRVVDRKPG